ncbi:MAG: universal stress protein [Burkholderiales bacterium]
MRTVLVAVDGSACAEHAIAEIVKMTRQSGPMDLHLINVQPRIFAEESLTFGDISRMDKHYYEAGGKALAPSEQALKAANIAFTSHRGIGPIAQIIVSKAAELNADAIVMGTHGHGRMAGLLLGSVSNKVLHLSPVPVTLVRGDAPVDFVGRLGAV